MKVICTKTECHSSLVIIFNYQNSTLCRVYDINLRFSLLLTFAFLSLTNPTNFFVDLGILVLIRRIFNCGMLFSQKKSER